MPVTTFDIPERYRYQVGFNSHLEYAPLPSPYPHIS